MRLTTKRDRWYFWRELFSYMIPMILIVGTVDVFLSFMQCSIHPEWSAPCSINWILGAMYGIFLILAIILAIISKNRLKKIKNQIEYEFLEATQQGEKDVENIAKNINDWVKSEDQIDREIENNLNKKKSRPKKIIVDENSTLKSKRKTTKTAKKTDKK